LRLSGADILTSNRESIVPGSVESHAQLPSLLVAQPWVRSPAVWEQPHCSVVDQVFTHSIDALLGVTSNRALAESEPLPV
jgi:hypothetical protein